MTLFLVQSRGSGMSLVDRIDTLTANWIPSIYNFHTPRRYNYVGQDDDGDDDIDGWRWRK